MIEREKETSSGTYPVVVTELPNQIVFRSSLNHVTHFTFVSKNNVSRHSIQHVRNEAFWIVLISQIFGRSDEGLSLKWRPALHFCEPALALISCFCCDLAIKMAKMLCSGFLMVFITRKVFRQISLEIHQFSFSYNSRLKKVFFSYSKDHILEDERLRDESFPSYSLHTAKKWTEKERLFLSRPRLSHVMKWDVLAS